MTQGSEQGRLHASVYVRAKKFCVTHHLLSLQSQPVYCRPALSAGQTSLRSQRSSGHTHTEGLTVTLKNRVLKFSGSHLLPSEECFIHERCWGYKGRPGVSGGFTPPTRQTSFLKNYKTCERCMLSKFKKSFCIGVSRLLNPFDIISRAKLNTISYSFL